MRASKCLPTMIHIALFLQLLVVKEVHSHRNNCNWYIKVYFHPNKLSWALKKMLVNMPIFFKNDEIST